jgi:glycerol-1-phosphate dehydrogenase [NAD(P)+]
VGIGSLASLSLYEYLMGVDLAQLDIEPAVAAWPDAAENEREITELFPPGHLAHKARLESREKHLRQNVLRRELQLLRTEWPRIWKRLAVQLIPCREVREMVAEAGCPIEPVQIGVSRKRMRQSFRKAYHIRRRFTILDLVRRTNLWGPALEHAFADGPFA